MLSRRLVICIAGSHALFIVVQIYLYTQYIAQSYTKQKNEQWLAQLKIEQQERLIAWHQLHDLKTVHRNAQQALHLQKITLSQIKQLPHYDRST